MYVSEYLQLCHVCMYVRCRMSIVDLAGSERSRKTQASGKVIKEAGNINVSLHILGKCINAMRHTNKCVCACVYMCVCACIPVLRES